ncbi:MAG: hypothetical protein EOO87_05085 [Pedobacter sp.]|nr:MAG: hypothetical protein EOO87_05085 [Pedobacter sp.]
MLISLLIYLFYRTSKTVINEIIIRVISLDVYTNLKLSIIEAMPLNDVAIYSLPEGLWILCITLTSRPYYIRFKNRNFDCVFIPIIFCLSLELFQLFGLTNGRFDLMDIGISIIFWILGCYIFTDRLEKQEIFSVPISKKIVCLGSYFIVYLAHVLK